MQDGDRNAGDGSEDELSGVADDCGLREVRDVGIGYGDGVMHLRGEGTEARAEDDADERFDGGTTANVECGGLRPAEDIQRIGACLHCAPPPYFLA